jgi:hypothetical protein
MGCLHNALRNRRKNIPPDSAPEFGGQALQTGFRTQGFEPGLHESLKLKRILVTVSGAPVVENVMDIERAYELYGIL